MIYDLCGDPWSHQHSNNHSWSAVCQQFPQTLPFTMKEDTQIWRVCVNDMDKRYDRLLLISQKGGVSLDWPCLDILMLFKLTPLPPDLFDCHGCLRKIRRRHYHINRATRTRRTGNLSSSSSMEARSNIKNSVANTVLAYDFRHLRCNFRRTTKNRT